MATFGLQPGACFEGKDRWQAELEEGYQRLSVGLSQVHAIVATNATFLSESFQVRIRPRVATLAVHHLLIADEVHNLGAERLRESLPEGIAMRLGLSATPERHYDPVGTKAVLGYFGQIIYEYPLSLAIADGRLCRYRYYPIPVELTEAETDEYEELTAKLAKFFSKGEDDSEMQQAAMRLLIKRVRLLAGAENKLTALDRVIASLPEPPKRPSSIAATEERPMPLQTGKSDRFRLFPSCWGRDIACEYGIFPFGKVRKGGKRFCVT